MSNYTPPSQNPQYETPVQRYEAHNEKSPFLPQQAVLPPYQDTGYPTAPQMQGYAPPMQGYAPQYTQPPVVQHVTYQSQAPGPMVTCYTESPVRMTCPNCNTVQVTSTTKKVGSRACLVVLLICFALWIGTIFFVLPILFLPCALIPLCMDGLKDTQHICPNCGFLVGVYRPNM